MNKVQETISEMANDFYAVGAIDKVTLRKFDINHCLQYLIIQQNKLVQLDIK